VLPERFRGIRVVGDVHGEAAQFATAISGARVEKLFVLQLGDLCDRGPDNSGAMRLALDLLDTGDGLFLLGNHDHKLRRALLGRAVSTGHGLAETLAAFDAVLARRAIAAIAAAPAWRVWRRAVFVHGALHPAMLSSPPPPDPGARRPDPMLAYALFGETTGRTRPDGSPERIYEWVDRIPQGMTVYCGHDARARDGRPFVQQGAAGGRAVFLDTGAGKGGHLSWLDLPRTGALPP
jgi:hypothetical protein